MIRKQCATCKYDKFSNVYYDCTERCSDCNYEYHLWEPKKGNKEMSKSEFKVGDTVKHKDYGVGYINRFDGDGSPLVVFDKAVPNSKLHNGDSHIVSREDRCWWFCEGTDLHELTLIQDNEVKDDDDVVNHPSHYTQYQTEVIDIIKDCLTEEQYKGYLLGNMLKYRMRAGWKGDREEDLNKSNLYQDWLQKEG